MLSLYVIDNSRGCFTWSLFQLLVILVPFGIQYCDKIDEEKKAFVKIHQASIDLIAHHNNTDILVAEYQISHTILENELKLKVIAKSGPRDSSKLRKNNYLNEEQIKKLFS